MSISRGEQSAGWLVRLGQGLDRIRVYLELIRFSHTIFALPFAALAAVWTQTSGGQGQSELSTAGTPWRWLGILLCMVFARSFAMAINRWADARLDAQNPRTANRHLPAGLVTTMEVMGLALVCGVGFVGSCMAFLPNRLPLLLSIPTLLFLMGYSWAKRFTWAVHFWLGAALMLAPICTWIALRGEIVQQNPIDLLPALWLGTAVALWVAGFDIIYACQDASFDRQQGLHSLPARVGVRTALRLAALFHAVMVIVLLGTPWICPQLDLGLPWLATMVLIALLLVVEHALVSHRDLSRVNLAFFHVNAIVSVAICMVGILDSWWKA
jgi:4-hydroxybenzoate polyprenyltransferase